jgi:hypothetical protein
MGRLAGCAHKGGSRVVAARMRTIKIGDFLRLLRMAGGLGFFEVDQWDCLSAESRQHPMQPSGTETVGTCENRQSNSA